MLIPFLIEYGSSDWCGCDGTVVCYAPSEDEAIFKAEQFCNDRVRDLLDDDDLDDDGNFDVCMNAREFNHLEDGDVSIYEVIE